MSNALEREYRYLLQRAIREKKDRLIEDLVVDAMKHDIDISDTPGLPSRLQLSSRSVD